MMEKCVLYTCMYIARAAATCIVGTYVTLLTRYVLHYNINNIIYTQAIKKVAFYTHMNVSRLTSLGFEL